MQLLTSSTGLPPAVANPDSFRNLDISFWLCFATSSSLPTIIFRLRFSNFRSAIKSSSFPPLAAFRNELLILPSGGPSRVTSYSNSSSTGGLGIRPKGML
jgi:hypothetical protein